MSKRYRTVLTLAILALATSGLLGLGRLLVQFMMKQTVSLQMLSNGRFF